MDVEVAAEAVVNCVVLAAAEDEEAILEFVTIDDDELLLPERLFVEDKNTDVDDVPAIVVDDLVIVDVFSVAALLLLLFPPVSVFCIFSINYINKRKKYVI